ncbi:peptidase U32 family protein [Mycoplasmoides alvi]|uniref:peptidase U32 family protein n=1 Tax=Mycoplasmoides alvi TaxID=78580 RepID=UPI000A96D7D3|nr:U32 family peptidase [Mycoplasmoides alvi]
MKKIIRNELLSPAGDFEKATIALDYGADAVFLGAKAYSLRSQASNFFMNDIKKTCKYAHKKNKKVYAAVNVICHNGLLKGFPKFIKQLYDTGIDALIVADPYIIDYVSVNYPNWELHLSTQQSITNSAAAKFWKENNISRIVLAREVSIKNLKKLIQNLKNKLEIEYFIHGAVCISYSGRCMMSNNWSLRDANVGGCAQSCRWKFDLMDLKNKNKYSSEFTMSPKDMMLLDEIKTLIKLNVASFKIEGRMKSLNYVATVTKAYRELIDACLQKHNNKKILNKLKNSKKDLKFAENRPSGKALSKGFTTINDMLYHDQERALKQQFAFVVEETKQTWVQVNCRNYFKLNQFFTIFGPKEKYEKLKLIKILDKNKNETNVANKPMEKYYLKFDNKSGLRISKNFIGRIEK